MNVYVNSDVRSELIMKMEGGPQEVFVRPGLSIGRASSNIFRISDPGVEHIHARVVQAHDGALHLKTESPAAKIVAADGENRDSLLLEDGAKFKIGSASFLCESLAVAPRLQPVGTATPVRMGGQCFVCGASLRDLAPDQRQCPACDRPLIFIDAPGMGFSGWIPLVIGPYQAHSFVARGASGILLGGMGGREQGRAAIRIFSGAGDGSTDHKPLLAAVERLVQLRHPALCSILDCGLDGKMPWMGMEWIEGSTLDHAVADQAQKRRYIPAAWIVDAAERLAGGLEFLHANNVTHGNMKPGNVMHSSDGGLGLIDFGLSRFFPPTDKKSGRHLAPEQRATRKASPASDIFSLGVILYELLTLRRLESGMETTSGARPDCPAALHSLVAACLRDDPASRPSAKDIVLGVGRLRDDPSWDGFTAASFGDPTPLAPPSIAGPTSAAMAHDSSVRDSITAQPAFEAAGDPDSGEEDEPEEDVEEEDNGWGDGTDREPGEMHVRDKRNGGIGAGRTVARQDGKKGVAKRHGEKKSGAKTIALAVAAMVILGALVGVGGILYNLMIAPSHEKADRHLERGERAKAMDMLRTLAEKHDDTQAMVKLGEMYWRDGEYFRAEAYLQKPVNEEVPRAQAIMAAIILDEKAAGREASEAIDLLQKAAPRDHLAQYYLGMEYLKGEAVERDEKTGLILLTRASDGGNSEADKKLAFIYMAGSEDVSGDIEKVISFLGRAANRGDAEANGKLGEIYAYGVKVPQDCARAVPYVDKALGGGYAAAREPQAYMLYFGKGMARDMDRAMGIAGALLKEDPKNAMANYLIGYAKLYGAGSERNPIEGGAQMLGAAYMGNPFAMFDLGRILYEGDPVPQDLEMAFMLLELAQKAGNGDAGLYLGKYYYLGLPPVKKDDALAYEYLVETKVEKDIDAMAIFGILTFERHGDGEEALKGIAMVENAAKLGSTIGGYYLGRQCVTGIGRDRDLDRAIEYLRKPALSLPIARFWLGRANYEQGDYAAAMENFQLAANHHVPEADLYIGKSYFLGRGVEINFERAGWHLYNAGAATDAEAQAMLAKINYFGLAGQRNYILVKSHMDKASIDDDELRFIDADMRYFGLGGTQVDRQDGLAKLIALVEREYWPAYAKLGEIYYDGIGVEQNLSRARELFTEAAKHNRPNALYMLGRMYREGINVERNDALAQENLALASDLGSMEAKTLLGKMFFRGDGAPNDPIAGLALLTDASRFGILDAQLFLGDVYLRGDGVPRSPNASAANTEAAAEAGVREAVVLYGAALMDEQYKPTPDPKTALELLEPIAEEGDVLALRTAGLIHLKNLVPQKSVPAVAVEYLTRAADLGDMDSVKYLADMYERGDVVPRDPQKAMLYMAKLSTKGDRETSVRLGELYLSRGAGYEDKAFEVFKDLADSGNTEAQYRVGEMYFYGSGVTMDKGEAFRYLGLAAQKGIAQACALLGEMHFAGDQTAVDYHTSVYLLTRGGSHLTPQGMAMLGWMNYYGLGTEQSNADALRHLEAAMKQREPLAAAALAKIYLEGELVIEDYQLARNYAEMSLKLNLPVSRMVLGRIYSEGLGVRKDVQRGVEYLREAAAAGEPEAQYRLGVYYRERRDGDGKENYRIAYDYLKMAADQAHKDARRIVSNMTRMR
ncbi:MAG: protein kinase [Planctomycetota bacterium]|nr:protein kinase [Planctomycetota bacterium]